MDRLNLNIILTNLKIVISKWNRSKWGYSKMGCNSFSGYIY